MSTVHGIEVPTEDGRTCVVEFEREADYGWWTVHISDTLIRQAPEGVTAALGMAVLQMKQIIEARACPHGDPTCPCQDGDTCHYEGPDPMFCPFHATTHP